MKLTKRERWKRSFVKLREEKREERAKQRDIRQVLFWYELYHDYALTIKQIAKRSKVSYKKVQYKLQKYKDELQLEIRKRGFPTKLSEEDIRRFYEEYLEDPILFRENNRTSYSNLMRIFKEKGFLIRPKGIAGSRRKLPRDKVRTAFQIFTNGNMTLDEVGKVFGVTGQLLKMYFVKDGLSQPKLKTN